MSVIGRQCSIGSVLVLIFLLSAPDAFAAACRISTVPLNFGTYDPGSPAPLDTAGEVTADCRGQAGIYQISLSSGASGNPTNRYMTLASEQLLYNIYLNAARTSIWGDGSGPTSLMSGIKLQNGRQIDRRSFYGRVFPVQQPSAGTYVDSLVVTIMF